MGKCNNWIAKISLFTNLIVDMSTNLAYYPLSRKTADPIGDTQHQSLQVINCRFDASQSYVDHSPSPLSKTPYKNTGSEVDYGMREGELLFTFRGSLGFDQPIARACLNNISINALTTEIALTKLFDSIVILGFCTKTCSVNSLNIKLTEAPVAAVSGHITALNVSKYTTIPGDVLIWCLPSLTRGSQTPVDGSSAMSPLRRVPEPVPLRILMEPFAARNAGNAMTAEQRATSAMLFSNSDMLEFGMQHALEKFVRQLSAHLVFAETLGEIQYQESVNVRGAGDKGKLYNNEDGYTDAVIQSDNSVNAFMKGLSKKVDGVFAPTAVLEELICNLMPLVGCMNQMITARRVAHVTRGSVPGKRHDISIQLGPISATKRLHGGF